MNEELLYVYIYGQKNFDFYISYYIREYYNKTVILGELLRCIYK